MAAGKGGRLTRHPAQFQVRRKTKRNVENPVLSSRNGATKYQPKEK
jgi:hypothetical protein